MAAIDTEPAYHAHAGAWRRFARPVTGVAVAASVALVAVMALQNLDPEAASPAPQVASAVSPQNGVVPVQEVWDRQPPPENSRLNGYLVQHNEYAASSGVQGVLPYVRIVGHNSGMNDQ
jgi:sigma-E factor negative regulatory protein RseA